MSTVDPMVMCEDTHSRRITDILAKEDLDLDDLVILLSMERPEDVKRLFEAAYQVKKRHVGTTVYLRGLIEISNRCVKDCYYCGIRKSNTTLRRYEMSVDEILENARLAWEWGYGSVVLQAGERTSAQWVARIEDTIRKIRQLSRNELGITLSLGEQDRQTCQRWFDAGAHRYLLRIETSDPALYKRLHPEDHSFSRRIDCLGFLRETGYQVGTGVMIGLPDQTTEHLAKDILFFRTMDVDMVGMGPYIPHHDTPLANRFTDFDAVKESPLELALRMIAATRLVLKDVNIAATTALQALSDTGREMGLSAGANVIMPCLTDIQYKHDYKLYENKPGLNENADGCRRSLESRIAGMGETISYGRQGDSPHFTRRTHSPSLPA